MLEKAGLNPRAGFYLISSEAKKSGETIVVALACPYCRNIRTPTEGRAVGGAAESNSGNAKRNPLTASTVAIVMTYFHHAIPNRWGIVL